MSFVDTPATRLAVLIRRSGRAAALIGAVLPLFLIGGLKFTQVEVDALKPLITGTPWLAWMYPAFGAAGASYAIVAVEIATALLLTASPWSHRAAVAGGALAAATFATTTSLLLVLPVWEPSLGFPALSVLGQFLIKDIALLGISLVVMAEGLSALASHRL